MRGESPNIDFLAGGGEMGALIRAYDWDSSTIGPPEHWPQSLRVTVRLLLNTGHPMLIWWGPELIQFYNDAYRQTMGPERHPSALGQRGRACWAEIWDIIGPQIDYVMAGKGSTWDEDRLIPVTRHGQRENVWWTYSYGPIDLEGGIGGVLVVCTDVTKQHLLHDSLNAQTRQLRQMFEQSPGFIAVLRGPDHIFELTNAAYRSLLGDRDIIGKPVRAVIPEIEGQGYFELLDSVFRSGKAHVGRRMPLILQTAVGTSTRQVFLDFVYAPIVETSGEVSGIFVEGFDITDHMRTEEHLRLINDELRHRVKNTLTVVSAIASQTLRGTGNEAALKKFQDRLGAFANAHDSLTNANWVAASVHDVIEGALTPHRTSSAQFSLTGDEVIIGAKQALSLALAIHELATNAIKYGALISDAGRVEISWKESLEQSVPTFQFLLAGDRGPPVVKPTKRGFGSQLIERVLTADFGKVDVSYDTAGLTCRLVAPMEQIRAPATLDL